MLLLLMNELFSPFVYVCLDENVHNLYVRKEQAKTTEYLPDFSVDAPENRDSPTSNIYSVSCRDETSPGGYFAFLLAVKDISALKAFLVSVPDKKIHLFSRPQYPFL